MIGGGGGGDGIISNFMQIAAPWYINERVVGRLLTQKS